MTTMTTMMTTPTNSDGRLPFFFLMGGSIFTAATNLPLRVGLERCQTTASTLPQRSHLPNQGKRPKENKE
jgi:hypothetical protein